MQKSFLLADANYLHTCCFGAKNRLGEHSVASVQGLMQFPYNNLTKSVPDPYK